jgi:hypothetical protein
MMMPDEIWAIHDAKYGKPWIQGSSDPQSFEPQDSFARYIRADLYADQARELAGRLARAQKGNIRMRCNGETVETVADVVALLRSIAETKP